MKKWTMLAMVSLMLVGLFGFPNVRADDDTSYQVLVFGDVHHDSQDYRKDVESLAVNRKKELARNLRLWGKEKPGPIPNMLAAASKEIPNMAFGVQLGDITQGDCGEGSLHEKAFRAVLEKFSSLAPADTKSWRFFVVKGNHDIRGPGAKEAFNAVVLPYLEQQFGQQCPVKNRANFARMQGPDLYLFFDSIASSKIDLQFVETTLEAHKNARYVFFLTHLPVLPSTRSKHIFWMVYEKKPELRRRLLELLAERNAIVLSAHIHIQTLVNYRSPKGTITQFSSFSMPSAWKKVEKYEEADGLKGLKATMEDAGKKNPEALADFQETLESHRIFTPGASYNVLHVTPEQVTIERHAGTDENTQSIVIKQLQQK
ncbi:MAG: metallophosphoesterase [Victivallales bacterium]|nr:metallophosphoesterase [Victivallales bacterium]